MPKAPTAPTTDDLSGANRAQTKTPDTNKRGGNKGAAPATATAPASANLGSRVDALSTINDLFASAWGPGGTGSGRK